MRMSLIWVGAFLAISPLTLATPAGDVERILEAEWFGGSPPDGIPVYAHCQATAPLDNSCVASAPFTSMVVYQSGCGGPSAGPQSCSPLTADLRIAISDGGATQDDVWTCRFIAGKILGCPHTGTEASAPRSR
jgi:hypothetical protein